MYVRNHEPGCAIALAGLGMVCCGLFFWLALIAGACLIVKGIFF